MSAPAVPQKHRSYKSSTAAPRAKTTRVTRFYGKKTREEIRADLGRHKWRVQFPLKWKADFFRVAAGSVELAVLFSILTHSALAPAHEKKKFGGEFSPPLTAADIADETGVSEREVLDAIPALIERGLLKRMGDAGPDRNRLKVLTDNFPTAKRPCAERTKPETSEKADESHRALGRRDGFFSVRPKSRLDVGEIEVRGKKVAVCCSNETTVSLDVKPIEDAGKLHMMILPPLEAVEEKPAARKCAAKSAQPTVIRMEEIRAVIQPIWKVHFGAKILDTALLAKVSAAVNGTALPFFRESLEEAFSRPGYKYKTGLVLKVAEDATKAWHDDAGKEWRQKHQEFAQMQARIAEREAERHQLFAAEILKSADSGEYSQEDLDWAREVLSK
jgi:hypothetical protein